MNEFVNLGKIMFEHMQSQIDALDFGNLELLGPTQIDKHKPPVLFLHGISSGAWIWQEYFLDWFYQNGYNPFALSLRNHGASADIGLTPHQTIVQDYLADIENAIEFIKNRLGVYPLLVGHSMGGYLAQKIVLADSNIKGCVLVCSTPPQGLTPLFINVVNNMMSPLHLFQATAYLAGFIYNLPIQARGIFLYTDVTKRDILRYDSMIQPSSDSYTAFLQMNFGIAELLYKKPKCKIAVVGAREDLIVPNDSVKITAMAYGVEPIWVEDAGHCLMLETNWQDSATIIKEQLDAMLN